MENYYNSQKKIQSEKFSMFVLFITFVVIGFMAMFAVGYKVGSDVASEKESKIYKTGYCAGYEHAELRYNNPKSSMKSTKVRNYE